MTTNKPGSVSTARSRMHPLVVRLMHWTNAVAMIVMILSGWKIYNDDVLFGLLHFPDDIVLGIWAQHALQWHFFGMWILVGNGLAYVAYGLASGRFRRLLIPLSPRQVLQQVIDALRFRLQHPDLTHYNAVQKMLYIGIILIAVLQVISGIAIWKPVQFSYLTALFYGFQGARLAHFIGMSLIVLFLLVHVTLALLVPKTLVAMLSGGPRIDTDGVSAVRGASPETSP